MNVDALCLEQEARYGLPAWFYKAIIARESYFNPDEFNQNGGYGLTQLTGAWYVGKPYPENLQAPDDNNQQYKDDMNFGRYGPWIKMSQVTRLDNAFDPQQNVDRFSTGYALPAFNLFKRLYPNEPDVEILRRCAFHWNRGMYVDYGSPDLDDYLPLYDYYVGLYRTIESRPTQLTPSYMPIPTYDILQLNDYGRRLMIEMGLVNQTNGAILERAKFLFPAQNFKYRRMKLFGTPLADEVNALMGCRIDLTNVWYYVPIGLELYESLWRWGFQLLPKRYKLGNEGNDCDPMHIAGAAVSMLHFGDNEDYGAVSKGHTNLITPGGTNHTTNFGLYLPDDSLSAKLSSRLSDFNPKAIFVTPPPDGTFDLSFWPNRYSGML